MFADEMMVNQAETRTDEKGRLIIPVWTNREPSENLILLKDEELNIYRLYSPKTIKTFFEKINLKIDESTTPEQELFYKKKLLNFSKSIIKNNKIDDFGRMSTGLIKKKINLVGAGDHLILELK